MIDDAILGFSKSALKSGPRYYRRSMRPGSARASPYGDLGAVEECLSRLLEADHGIDRIDRNEPAWLRDPVAGLARFGDIPGASAEPA